MTWRVANSLQVLRSELKQVYPLRDTESDGTIGDAAHASRNSDHNPYIIDANGVGVVRAFDIDEDLDGNKTDSGPDAIAIAEHLRALGKAGDPRVRYVIYDGKIASSKQGWAWRPYTGPNAHKKHVHLSVVEDPAGYDSTAPWGFVSVTPPAPPPEEGFMSALTPEEQRNAYRILKELDRDYLTKGQSVRQVIVETKSTVDDIASGKRPV